jgi:copper oxidase (laccase) domain-containing protein
MSILVETFPALAVGGPVLNAFIGRVSDLDVSTDRETALARLASHHEQARRDLGFGSMAFVTAEQVHGIGVAVVEAATPSPVLGADALVTARPNVCLGIYVADCCAVYAVDTEHNAIGLAHSGRKGTELEVVPAMLRKMACAFGTDPGKVVVQLSPCIRPPLYEVDFAARITRQCRAMGVGEVVDCGSCTGAALDRYYSYRMEKGKTGRMLALLAIQEERGE